MRRVVVVVDGPSHRDSLAHPSLAFRAVERKTVAEVGRDHAAADVDADDVGDDSVRQRHREPDRCAGPDVGIGHHPDRLGERRMVDKCPDLFETVVLDERLVVDEKLRGRVFACNFDCHDSVVVTGEAFNVAFRQSARSSGRCCIPI